MLLFGINLVPWFSCRGVDVIMQKAWIKLLLMTWCSFFQKKAAANEKLDISKNNLLVFYVHGWRVENQAWVEKVNVQEFLYTCIEEVCCANPQKQKLFCLGNRWNTTGRAGWLRGDQKKKKKKAAKFISVGNSLVRVLEVLTDVEGVGWKQKGLWDVRFFGSWCFSSEIKLKKEQRGGDAVASRRLTTQALPPWD